MKLEKAQVASRAILSIVLLYFVWKNTHWSVALCLTLISVGIETLNYLLRLMITNIKKLADIQKYTLDEIKILTGGVN